MVIDLKDQYHKRTMEYMLDLKRKNPDVEFYSDGLTVSLVAAVSSFFIS